RRSKKSNRLNSAAAAISLHFCRLHLSFDLWRGCSTRPPASRVVLQYADTRARNSFCLAGSWIDIGARNCRTDGLRADPASHVATRLGRWVLHVLGDARALVVLGKFTCAAGLALARRLHRGPGAFGFNQGKFLD